MSGPYISDTLYKRLTAPLSDEAVDSIIARIPPASVTLTPEQIGTIAGQIPPSVTEQERAAWNAKQDALGFDPASLASLNALTEAVSYKEPANINIQGHITGSHAPVDAVSLATVKADTDIASVISLKHSNSNDHAPGSDDQDLSGKVDKVTGSSLVSNTEITKLAGIAAGAQKNSDITQAEIEAKLTGAITSHSHAGGSDPFATAKLILAVDKPTGANVTPVTLGLSFVYEANSRYVIDIYALVAPAVATTGCGFMIDVSSVVTFVGTFISHQLAVTGTLSGAHSAGDLAAASSGVSSGMVLAAAAGGNFVYGGGLLITGANPGTATFFFRSETTAVTTCKAGTCIRVMKMN